MIQPGIPHVYLCGDACVYRHSCMLSTVACAPSGYHLVNMLLHVLVSVLVVGLALRLRPNLPLGAAVAALLFASHPVHTEAVCNTVGRAELLSAALLLVSTRAYAAASAHTGSGVIHAAIWYAAACFSAVLAALCKETGLLALVLGAAEDLLHQPPFQKDHFHPSLSSLPEATTSVKSASHDAHNETTQDQQQQQENSMQKAMLLPGRGWWLRTCVAASLTIVFLLDAQARRGKRLTPAFSYVDNPISHGCQVARAASATDGIVAAAGPDPSNFDGLYDKLIGPPATPLLTRRLSGGYISAYYMWLLFWPVTLSPDYSFAAFPLVENWLDIRNAATAAMLVGLLVFGTWAVYRTVGAQRVGCCMALLILTLPLLPACQLFLPVGTVLGERLLYTPSIGYCLVVGWAAEAGMSGGTPQTQRRLVALFAGACCCGYTILTFRRSFVWYDDATLFKDAVLACPNSAKIHATLGAIAMQKHNATAAEANFQRAVEIFPEYDDGLYSLGRLYFEGAVPEKQGLAAALLLRAVEANPLHDKALDYYGQYLARSGHLHEAEGMMEKGLAASARMNLALMRNLAVVKNALGKVKEARGLIAEAERA